MRSRAGGMRQGKAAEISSFLALGHFCYTDHSIQHISVPLYSQPYPPVSLPSFVTFVFTVVSPLHGPVLMDPVAAVAVWG